MYATLEQQFDEHGIAGWAVVFYDQEDHRIMSHICLDEPTARCLLTDPAAQEERSRMFAEARRKAEQRRSAAVNRAQAGRHAGYRGRVPGGEH